MTYIAERSPNTELITGWFLKTGAKKKNFLGGGEYKIERRFGANINNYKKFKEIQVVRFGLIDWQVGIGIAPLSLSLLLH